MHELIKKYLEFFKLFDKVTSLGSSTVNQHALQRIHHTVELLLEEQSLRRVVS